MLAQPAQAAQWKQEAEARQRAINKYLWNPEKGMFFDYDFTTGKQSSYVYATIFYPLWSGLATKEQAAAVDSHLALLDRPGGLASSTYLERPAVGFALWLGSVELVGSRRAEEEWLSR